MGDVFSQLAGSMNQQAPQGTNSGSTANPSTAPPGGDIFTQLASGTVQGGYGSPQDHPSMVGPTISSNTNENLHAEDVSSDPFARAGLKIATPFAKKVMDAVDKLREIENFTPEGKQEHPIQAHLGDVANRLEGFLFGNQEHGEAAIGSGKYGMLTNPALALVSGGPEAGEGIVNGIRSLRGASSEAAEAGAEAPGIIKQLIQGRGVAQPGAKAAIREAAEVGEETPLLEGHSTALDEKLRGIGEKERAAYKAQDEAAGFDVKETRAKLKDAEYKVKQPEIDDATKERLQKTITESKQSIAEAEKRMGEKGVDAKAADTLFKQRKAGEDFRKIVVKNVSPDGETVRVDPLWNAAKNLRNTPKGDRLEQFLGKEGADQFMAKLEEAHNQGVHAVKMRWIAGAIGTATGVGAEGLRLVKSLAANP